VCICYSRGVYIYKNCVFQRRAGASVVECAGWWVGSVRDGKFSTCAFVGSKAIVSMDFQFILLHL